MITMDKIKMVDLQAQYLRIKEDVDNAIQKVLTSTAFIQGPEVEEFAQHLGDYTGSKSGCDCGFIKNSLDIINNTPLKLYRFPIQVLKDLMTHSQHDSMIFFFQHRN